MKKLSEGLVLAFAALPLLLGCSSKPSTMTSEKITVLPVENLDEDFIMGVDISSLVSVEKSGGVFYDANGKKADPVALLKEGGANWVRLRVWNDPKTADGKTYGGGACDIDTACAIGKRATAAGMGVLIDFHYSDFWADPNKQKAPKAWKDFSAEQKKTAAAEFTTESLKKLKSAGVKVGMVQVGNEINIGVAGETLDPEVYGIIGEAAKAVRAFDPSIQIAVHYTDPLAEGFFDRKASLLKKFNVDYDIFSTSFYPFWHGDAKKLTAVLRKIANVYHKKVMVAEVSYPFTNTDGDGFGNVVSEMGANNTFDYPVSVEGQAIAVRDVIEAVAKVKNAGVGVFYWEPAWIPANKWVENSPDAQAVFEKNHALWEKYGSGWASWAAHEYDVEVRSEYNGGTWDNQAFFDYDGKVLESINTFKYARTGSKGQLRPVRVESPVVEFAYGKKGELPSAVKVTYNTGDIVDEKISWNGKDKDYVLEKPDFGEYRIDGVTEKGFATTCVVKVTASNYLSNGGFESGDLTGWTVVNPSEKGSPKVDKNNQNAKEGLFYFTAWEKEDYSLDVFQKLGNLGNGKYKAFASYQGTGVRNPSGTKFYCIINRKDGTSVTKSVDVTIPNVWKDFFRAEIPLVEVDDTVESVIVGSKIACHFDEGSGANGAWIVMDDVNFLLSE